MNEYIKQFEYIKNQLTYIKNKVELDNQLGLFDINKISEDIFMHILNDVYALSLKNANDILHENFPAIDLVDEVNKKVIQVTSTTSLSKAKNTLKKFNLLKSHQITDSTNETLKKSILIYRSFPDYEEYEISFLYINKKPNTNTEKWKTFLINENLDNSNLLGIDDILTIVQSDNEICQRVYTTMQQRIDSLAYSFNIESYFDKFETQIDEYTSNKFSQYETTFMDFIQSSKQVFDIYAVGGNGKSHLLKYFSSMETEYIPLIFTKQVNVEEDLKKLSYEKKYLFIYDDIDRFLDTSILVSLLSFVINNDNTKLLLSYRTASKSIIKTIFRKFNNIDTKELEIIWEEADIKELVKLHIPDMIDENILKLSHTFNNNPYLITQAIKGDISSIKDFSKKIVDDTKAGLEEFSLSENDIKEKLFLLSLITPISVREIEKYIDIDIIKKLEEVKILRKLSSKYRFNPDIQGDLYLAYYIDDNQEIFEDKIKDILPIFSETIFTNLGYALAYNKSDSLQEFIKKVISKWNDEKDYRSDYLPLINKVVNYAPVESFLYLENITKNLIPKENEHTKGQLTDLFTKVTDYGDYNVDKEAINLGSIEPIVSKLIDILKNNTDVDGLEIKHIIKYLSSDLVLSLPKPYYDNHTLESIFKKIVSPLHTSNFNVIYSSLKILENWLEEEPINLKKINLLKEVLQSLLSATFENNSSNGFTHTFSNIPLNFKHTDVINIISYAGDILLQMLQSNEHQILYYVLDSINSIGSGLTESMPKENIKIYSDIKKVFLNEIVNILTKKKELFIISKIEELAINIINFHIEKEEALLILKAIDRSDEYILYQIVKGVDFLIIDYDKYYLEYLKQENIKDWMFDTIYKKHEELVNDDELKVVQRLSVKYQSSEELITLVNILDMSNWNSYATLLLVLKEWLILNDTVIIDICINNMAKITNNDVNRAFKEFSLKNSIQEIKLEYIDDKTSMEDLIIYIYAMFDNYNVDKLIILNKIIETIEQKGKDEIRRYIAIISQKMYFTVANHIDSYLDFEEIIDKFLGWQLEYKFNIESYITQHILKTIKPKYSISESITEKLDLIIKDNEIYIREYELKAIYKILDYGLEELVENLYNKLVSKNKEGKYNHHFFEYYDHDKISECILIKEYIKSYEDFEYLTNKVLDYYEEFTEYIENKDGSKRKIKISLDYFLKYSIKKEFLERLFNSLIKNNEIEKIKILYLIIPVSNKYFEIIVKTMNILDGEIDNSELINYLSQVGKIKSYSSVPMENSSQILSEEELFKKIQANIDSLALQLKIKEELKYIEAMKKQEIERDIEFLLGKE